MLSEYFRQLRMMYLIEYHPKIYKELKDDGVLDAHLRHTQFRALDYFEILIKAGHSEMAAREKVWQEIISIH
jgi:hypothetical protein